MPTLLQILTELETVAKLVGPSVEPMVLAALEKLKASTTNPLEIDLINTAEAIITAYFTPTPAPAPAA